VSVAKGTNGAKPKFLSREAIFAAKDLDTVEVEVPEWHGTVMIRGLTGRERDDFEASMMERRGKHMVPNVANVRAKLIVKCVIDESGKRVFTDQDANEMGEHSAAAVNRIYEAASKLSGLTDEDVEELAGDFTGILGSDSATS
jgi:hypothetical protein